MTEDLNIEPQVPIQNKAKLLYDAVSKDYNIGTYDEFYKKIQDPIKRKAFYDGVGNEYNLGSYDDFSNKVKKKVSGEVSSPTKYPSVSPDFEKGKAFAEKGFVMKGEGTKEQKRISIEPSLLGGAFGGAPKVKILEEGEDPSALSEISGAVAKGMLQGKVANILSAGKRPTEDELGEIAQLQSDAQLFPQSKSEKLYQEKGLKGLFKDNPLLGAQFIAETMASSLSSLIVASSKTVPAAALAGAAVGAPTGVGALVGAGYGLLAGQSAAGYNLSTSQDILNSLSENGVDVSNKESLIKAFSDETKMAKIRNTAAKYGVPILIFDAATAGLAGKLAAGAIGKSLSKKLLAGLGETGIQIAGGSGGELSGQLASGKKVNWDEIVVEGLAEVPGGASEVAAGIAIERSKSSSNNKTLATQIATQGVQNGSEDAIVNLNRDLSNNVITPEQYQEGVDFVQKASQVAEKIPENVTGENKVKSIELLVERNDIKDNNQNLIQQKQASDEAYHAGIDEEIKTNEEKIKKIDSEVYDISKKPSTGGKKYVVDGKEISQEEFDALQDKPIGTKEIIAAEVKVKPKEEGSLVKEKITTEEPTEINGLKVVKKIDEDIYQVEPQKLPASGGGEAFFTKYYTSDGREVLVPEEIIKKAEAKASAVDIKRIVEPSKPISEMNSEELGNFATETKKALKKQDKDFEGKTEKEKEDGGYYDVIDEVEDLRDASERANFIENAENVNDLANSVKSILSNIKGKEPDEYQLAILNAAKNKAIELGIDSKDLIKNISSKIANQYKDVEDAELMVKSALEKLIPSQEFKPAEVKKEAITKSKFKKPINQELLETIPEKNISDVVEKIDNGKAELNVDVFPATNLGTDNKITNNQIVYLLHSQGKEIGVLTVNNETLGNRSESSIAGVVLHPDVKGKGIGKEIYRFVNNDLINKGRKPLKSDFDITPDAINVWKSLVKSGEAREVGVAKNGKPLFEMNKPTEVKVKAEVVKPKVEKQAEPKTLSVENKEYTTKTGRQKVVLKNSDLKVIDIKTGKEASPATRRKALDEYVERYDFSKGKTAQENTKEAPEGLSSEEVDRFAIEQSENPLEVASAYIYEEPISKFSGSKDAMIAEFGVGKVTQESFKRWKDENLITGGMALTYFNKKEGLPLDVLAKSMSDHYGKEVDPQDIAEFIVKYPSGSSAALRDIESPTGRMAAERFKELTGLDLYRGMAEKIVKAEYEKRKQIEKDLIKEEYETAKQLEDAYWAAYKETDGFTKESPVSKVKPSEAAEKSVEEAYKDLTINQKRQIINSKFDELLKELKIEKICPT
jgi:hypothetical protein